jgi:hypothetical protein
MSRLNPGNRADRPADHAVRGDPPGVPATNRTESVALT